LSVKSSSSFGSSLSVQVGTAKAQIRMTKNLSACEHRNLLRDGQLLASQQKRIKKG
jgi:hypothetical protein